MTTIGIESAVGPLGEAPDGSKSLKGIRAVRSVGGRRMLGAAITLAICVVGWLQLAPPGLGGSTSYVVTSGVSMLPDYHAGDLVILHEHPRYNVGDVAAYHNGELGIVVLHRIVAVHGTRYIFRGDNNSWNDSFEPTRGQVIGSQVVDVHGWGRYVSVLRRPVVASVLLALLWLLSFGPARRPGREMAGPDEGPAAVERKEGKAQ